MTAHDEHRVRLDDGAETIVETWGERGPIVLCVHGMTSSRKSWERLARHLAGRYRVVAYDQRGHGESSHIEGPMTLDRACADLRNVVSALGEPVDTLVGHSWGGAVVVIVSPEMRPRRVVAIDPMIRQVSATWYDEFLDELHGLFAVTGDARAAKVREDYAHWPEIDREGKVHAVATMTTHPIEHLRDENPPEHWDLRATTAEYPVPLLLAMAEVGESIVDALDLAEIKPRSGTNVRIVTFNGQGHNLHRTDFDRFANVLDNFL